jgi:Domain of unknown function (DUF4388)
MADAFPIGGTIDPKAFPFLLMDLHRNGATGSLKVDGPSYQKALYYRGGRILFGSSNDPRDQLGSILIESGKLTPEQLEDVNAKVGPGNPLAKILSESGFVNQRELSEAARSKVERILSDVMAYESGSFEFEDGVLPKGAVDLKLSTERLTLTAVRRIADRNFVLRFLDGMETVLTPAADLASHLAEIQAEVGGLPDQLDGRRSLKQAAAEARIEEFEASKIACALLFMGLVQKGPGSGEEAVAFVEPEPAGAELDLGGSGEEMDFGARSASGDGPFFVEESAPEAPAEQAFFAEPEPEPRKKDVDETLLIAHSDPSKAGPAPFRAEPEPEPVPSFTTEPEPVVSPPPRTGPSKEDLAALDALLNARPPEGPMEPFDKGAAAPERWEPKFNQTSGRRARRTRTGPSPLVIVGGIAAVVVVGIAAWWFLLRPPPARSASTAATPVTTPAVVPAATPTPVPVATAPPPTAAATGTPAPTPSPAATRSTPSATPPPKAGSGAATSLAEAREDLRKGDLPAAARAFEANLRGHRASQFSIQILVACASDTVVKAVANAPAAELFILPVDYRGRSCYRVCWGIYDSESRAGSALSGVPDYFRNGGAHPKVVPTTALIP